MFGILRFAGLIKPIARTLRVADKVVQMRNESDLNGGVYEIETNEAINNLESVLDLLFEAAERSGISRAELVSEIEKLAG